MQKSTLLTFTAVTLITVMIILTATFAYLRGRADFAAETQASQTLPPAAAPEEDPGTTDAHVFMTESIDAQTTLRFEYPENLTVHALESESLRNDSRYVFIDSAGSETNMVINYAGTSSLLCQSTDASDLNSYRGDLEFIQSEIAAGKPLDFNSCYVETAPLQQIVEDNAYHKLKPYGQDPLIETQILNGEIAKLISPTDSEVQTGAFIIPMPKPQKFAGASYSTLVITVEGPDYQAILDQMVSTFQYID